MALKKGKNIAISSPDPRGIKPAQMVRKLIDEPIEEINRLAQEFKTIAETLAKSSVCIKNFTIDELRPLYKYQNRMKCVDKYFPYARLDGHLTTTTLYVDEPMTEYDADICYNEKTKVMKKMGFNYVVIEKDSTLLDALQQLELI